MIKYSKKALFILILFVAVFLMSTETVIGQSSKTQYSTTTNFSVSIDNATYGNFDNQTDYNDIAVFFNIYCPVKEGYTQFDIYFSIALPSGTVYNAAFTVVTDIYPVPELVIYYYNIATEPGIYYAVITTYMYGNGSPAVSQASIAFDPPPMGNGLPGYT